DGRAPRLYRDRPGPRVRRLVARARGVRIADLRDRGGRPVALLLGSDQLRPGRGLPAVGLSAAARPDGQRLSRPSGARPRLFHGHDLQDRARGHHPGLSHDLRGGGPVPRRRHHRRLGRGWRRPAHHPRDLCPVARRPGGGQAGDRPDPRHRQARRHRPVAPHPRTGSAEFPRPPDLRGRGQLRAPRPRGACGPVLLRPPRGRPHHRRDGGDPRRAAVPRLVRPAVHAAPGDDVLHGLRGPGPHAHGAHVGDPRRPRHRPDLHPPGAAGLHRPLAARTRQVPHGGRQVHLVLAPEPGLPDDLPARREVGVDGNAAPAGLRGKRRHADEALVRQHDADERPGSGARAAADRALHLVVDPRPEGVGLDDARGTRGRAPHHGLRDPAGPSGLCRLGALHPLRLLLGPVALPGGRVPDHLPAASLFRSDLRRRGQELGHVQARPAALDPSGLRLPRRAAHSAPAPARRLLPLRSTPRLWLVRPGRPVPHRTSL
ncbi:MAG: Alginate biosynthesis protein Alg8, partial [uncultured Rubellimicrobium sp.]